MMITSGILILLLYFSFVNTQNRRCITADGRKDGICIDLRKCDSLFNLIQKQNLSQEDRKFLKSSQCGYDGYPLVCCNSTCPTEETITLTPLPGLSANELPKPGVCGIFPEDRLIGGIGAALDAYPWSFINERGFHCGGVLINKDYVITAAHCVNGIESTELGWNVSSVRLGELDTSTTEDCEFDVCSDRLVDVPVSERISHDGYKVNSSAHDIALLRLARSVKFSAFIRPICLPLTPNFSYSRGDIQWYKVVGWGQGDNKSKIKLQVDVDVVPLDKCNNAYQSQNISLTPEQLCAGTCGDVKVCPGNSGGPLQFISTNGSFQFYSLAGVESIGVSNCSKLGLPAVSTRVEKYTGWILKNMRP